MIDSDTCSNFHNNVESHIHAFTVKALIIIPISVTNTRFFRYMDWKEWLFVNLIDNNKLVNNTPSCLVFEIVLE